MVPNIMDSWKVRTIPLLIEICIFRKGALGPLHCFLQEMKMRGS